MNQSEVAAADALRKFALDEQAKAYVLAQPKLYALLHRAAVKYIGGESLDACRDVAQQINATGQAVTIDYMGESTRDCKAATDATSEFLQVAKTIAQYGLNASVSLDLSHVGLVVDESLCVENMSAIAEAAREAGTEVMISAEGTDRTASVLRVHEQLCKNFNNVGITIQAFLYRSTNDIQALLERPGKVRLVKGAFDASSEVAMRRGTELNDKYMEFVRLLIRANRPCSVATHDPESVDTVIPEADGESVEFEMLRGVCRDQLTTLKEQGFPTRVYLPYGREWFLYLLNRLAEYPPSLFEAIVAMVEAREVGSKVGV